MGSPRAQWIPPFNSFFLESHRLFAVRKLMICFSLAHPNTFWDSFALIFNHNSGEITQMFPNYTIKETLKDLSGKEFQGIPRQNSPY